MVLLVRKHPLARCEECPFQYEPFVPTQNLHPVAKLAVIGEAPGAYEAARGIPFTGPSGRLLDQVLTHHGYQRSEVMVSNVCLCRPENNDDPPKAAIAACKPRLDAEIASSGVESIIAVGGTAAGALIDPKRKISNLRVGPAKPYIEDDRIKVVATWHPAYCLRTPDAFPSFVSDLAKLKANDNVHWTEPNYRVFEDGGVICQAIDRLATVQGPLVIDIECGVEKDISYVHPDQYNLLCVGISYAQGKAVVFGGSGLHETKVQIALRDLLKNRKIIAHNGKFDLAGLFPTLGPLELWFDTMLASYCLDERPGLHSLEKLSIEHLGSPDWKREIQKYLLRGHKDYSDIPKPVLYKYNAYDVCNTYDLWKFLSSKMGEREHKQHSFLVSASNALMNLERAGINFDSDYSEDLGKEFEKELFDLELEISRITDKNLNPRSPQQVTRYLAEEGIIVTTTEADVLEQLLERLDSELPVSSFIKLLLIHRKKTKLHGTYVKGFRKRLHHDKIYTTYTLHGTTSGRTASKNPNMQNVCYSDDTEILTNLGWRLFSNLYGKEKVAQWWPDGTIDFVEPENYIDLEHNGKLINIHSDSVDLLVTPDHTMISRARRQKTVFDDKASDWIRWAPYANIDRKFIRGGTKLSGRVLNDAERLSLQKAIAFQADGTVRHDMHDRGVIKVTSVRKRQQLKLIFDDIRFNKISLDAWIHLDEVREWVNTKTRDFKIEKLIELSSDDLSFFVNQVMEWDGDFTRRKTYLQHEDRELSVHAVQIAAILSGHSTKWYNHPEGYKVVNIHPKPERQCSNTSISTIDYEGHVYCVTVPSSAIIIRRNNQVVISGNCRDKRIKHQFTVEDEGNVFVHADYKQAEGRVIATLAQDQYLANIFRNKERDIFNELCDDVYGVDNWTKENRVSMKSIFYGCVPLNTKILTRRGWLTYDQIIPNEDETIGYDPTLGKSRWTKIMEVLLYKDADLVQLSNDTISFSVTPNHRWFGSICIRPWNGRTQKHLPRVYIEEFVETSYIKKEHLIHLSKKFESDGKLDITDQEASILGWAMSDGSIKISEATGITSQGSNFQRQGVMFRICQSTTNTECVREINNVLTGYEHTTYKYSGNNQIWWNIPSAVARDLLRRAGLLTRSGHYQDIDPIQFVFSMSDSQRFCFIRSIYLGDGTKGKKIISQNEGWLSEAITMIGYLEGYVVRSVKNNYSSWSNNNHYKHIFRKGHITGQKLVTKKLIEKEDVWCVRTELGTWTMNQNGLTVLTGNSAYGRGVNAIALELQQQGSSITVEETRTLMREFNSLISSVIAWQTSIKHKVLSGQDLTTPFGRKRSFWLITEQNKSEVLNEALSFLPQSIASDICLSALIQLQPRLQGLATTRLTIHDALIFECKAQDAEEVAAIATEEMVASGLRFTNYVPFAIDISTGRRWSEL